MMLAEITSTEPRRFHQGQTQFLLWPNFWVSIDNGKSGQWVGHWSRPEVEAVVARVDFGEGPELAFA